MDDAARPAPRAWAIGLGWIAWAACGAAFLAAILLGWGFWRIAAAVLGLGWANVLMVYGRGERVRWWIVALSINSLVAYVVFLILGQLNW